MAKKRRLGRKANAPRQGDLQEGQIHSREILRMDKAIQEADSKVRKTGRDIPGINPHCLHRDTVESIEIGSRFNKHIKNSHDQQNKHLPFLPFPSLSRDADETGKGTCLI